MHLKAALLGGKGESAAVSVGSVGSGEATDVVVGVLDGSGRLLAVSSWRRRRVRLLSTIFLRILSERGGLTCGTCAVGW